MILLIPKIEEAYQDPEIERKYLKKAKLKRDYFILTEELEREENPDLRLCTKTKIEKTLADIQKIEQPHLELFQSLLNAFKRIDKYVKKKWGYERHRNTCFPRGMFDAPALLQNEIEREINQEQTDFQKMAPLLRIFEKVPYQIIEKLGQEADFEGSEISEARAKMKKFVLKISKNSETKMALLLSKATIQINIGK